MEWEEGGGKQSFHLKLERLGGISDQNSDITKFVKMNRQTTTIAKSIDIYTHDVSTRGGETVGYTCKEIYCQELASTIVSRRVWNP